MTIVVIHNWQRDETIPKARQESEMSLEVHTRGPLSLISTQTEGYRSFIATARSLNVDWQGISIIDKH